MMPLEVCKRLRFQRKHVLLHMLPCCPVDDMGDCGEVDFIDSGKNRAGDTFGMKTANVANHLIGKFRCAGALSARLPSLGVPVPVVVG